MFFSLNYMGQHRFGPPSIKAGNQQRFFTMVLSTWHGGPIYQLPHQYFAFSLSLFSMLLFPLFFPMHQRSKAKFVFKTQCCYRVCIWKKSDLPPFTLTVVRFKSLNYKISQNDSSNSYLTLKSVSFSSLDCFPMLISLTWCILRVLVQ